MASQPSPAGAPTPKPRPSDGPCILVVWLASKKSKLQHFGRYFPRPDQNEIAAEAACFEWFASRGSIILSMTWAWGPIPPSVTRSHRVLLG